MASYTNLNISRLANAALEAFTKELLPLTAFSTSFNGENGTAKGTAILVPLISALTATTFGGTYAICGGTKSVITVTLNRHKMVNIGQQDLDALNNSASSLDSFGYQQGSALAQAVLEDIFTLLTTANFGFVTGVSTTDFGIAQLRSGRLKLNQSNAPRSPRVAILDCVPYDVLLGVTNFVQAQMFADNQVLQEGKIMRALGMNIHEVNDTFGSTNSVMGFVAHASAIAIAMRYVAPQTTALYQNSGAFSDPKTGATFGLRDFYDPATGSRYIALECNYGYSAGLTNAGRVIKRLD
jgi:hypothetical protein